MTTTDPRPICATQAHIEAALSIIRSELSRCDSKASLLLALTGASLAGIVSAAASAHLPGPTVAIGAIGAVLLLAATMTLLDAVRPNLKGTGWPTWGQLSHEDLHERLTAGRQVDEVQFLALAAHRKYRRIQVAVDLIRAGLTLLALAAVLSASL